MNILILDFDGVINNTSRLNHCQVWIDDSPTGDYFSPKLSKNIDRLCEDYNASIVISSSWREHFSFTDLEMILKQMGINAPLIGTTTPDILSGSDPEDYLTQNRGLQISQWLQHYEDLQYIIIDDNISASYGHENNFIKCDKNIGFDLDQKLISEICEKIWTKI